MREGEGEEVASRVDELELSSPSCSSSSFPPSSSSSSGSSSPKISFLAVLNHCKTSSFVISPPSFFPPPLPKCSLRV